MSYAIQLDLSKSHLDLRMALSITAISKKEEGSMVIVFACSSKLSSLDSWSPTFIASGLTDF